ncbi:sensor histidine kinase [Streptococcus phocae subsp. salmonis]|uniref:sensor histidine kinase n=1 Tax=Streptococcus phocae TaxID=119224 RepID=UPI0005312092|nr:GHKL domain-containing protein [Streptococcus phocae]KGR73305.1 histidine kinase [Streptococcus phocae subsp. salmonis]
MEKIQYAFESIVTLGTIIIIFFGLNRLSFSFKSFLIMLSLRIPVAVVTVTADAFLGTQLFSYLDLPLYGLILSLVFFRPLPKSLLIFYGLFPFVLENLFYRFIGYFVLPLFGAKPGLFEGTLTYIFSAFGSLCLVIGFMKWNRYDFAKLRTETIDFEDKRILKQSNWAMGIYYVVMQSLAYLEYVKGIETIEYRRLILVFYLIFFMGMIKQLDAHLREKLQEKLAFQQHLQLRDMENYSNRIEELYREVRGFRHDYANVLTTLRLGIEENNMDQIKEIYESVLKASNKKLRHHKFDLGRLLNIKNSALKSLLAAKFTQATDQGISASLEIPEEIAPKGMERVDFVTVVSIFCDNAIEAAVTAINPKINLAYLTIGDKQMFIIENSMKEETIDYSKVYDYGYSSKGGDRGVGLYNVMKILEDYQNVSLSTKSHSYTFSQVLEIYL